MDLEIITPNINSYKINQFTIWTNKYLHNHMGELRKLPIKPFDLEESQKVNTHKPDKLSDF